MSEKYVYHELILTAAARPAVRARGTFGCRNITWCHYKTDNPIGKVMGWDLAVAVEVYDRDRKKWFTVESEAFRRGSIVKFKEKKISKEIRQKVVNQARNNGDEPLSEDEIEGEVGGLIQEYFVFPIERYYNLFAYLADVANKPTRKIKPQSGLRGPPLDTSVPYEDLGNSAVSFFTLAELERIKWDQRIDEPLEIPISTYDDNYRNTRGKKLVITEQEWLLLDEEARDILSGQNNLKITLNPLFLRYEGLDFLDILLYMTEAANTWKIDPNDMRMVLIFTY